MKNWSLWTGLAMFAFMLFISFVGPHLPFIDDTIPEHRMRFYEGGEIGRAPFPPSLEDPLGTDREAGDILSMLVNGAKDTLKIIVLITLIRYMIAIPMAFLASTKKGIAYMVSNGWYSLFGSIPTIFAAILLLEIIPTGAFGNDVYAKILLIALIEVGRVSYIFSHEIYEVCQKEFVQASMTVGSTPFQLSMMHYLPSVSQSLVVNFFNDLARVTLLLGQLALFQYFIEHVIDYIPGGGTFHEESGYNSVTGLFDWPGLLSAARYEVMKAIWIPLSPAIALTLLLLTFQLLSEGFRKLFERRTSKEKHSVFRRLAERVGEVFIASKAVASVVVIIPLVLIGYFIMTSVEKNNVEMVDGVVEDVRGLNPQDPFGDGKYVVFNEQIVPTTLGTTEMGGFYDFSAFIGEHMTAISSKQFEGDVLTLECIMSESWRCEQPIITFNEPVPTVEEAYSMLSVHLPIDALIEESFQLNDNKYVFNLTSQLMEESYSRVIHDPGKIAVTLHMTPEYGIEQATIDSGHHTKE